MSASAETKTDTASSDASVADKMSDLKVAKEKEDNGNGAATKEDSANGDEEAPLNPADRSLLQKVIRRGLVDNKNDLQVQRRDPKSPLYSVKSFEALNLKPSLLKGVYGMGFNAPSKIQETALPTLLADPPLNMIAQSQSGTGKTAAFVLAMLSRVDPTKNYPQVGYTDNMRNV